MGASRSTCARTNGPRCHTARRRCSASARWLERRRLAVPSMAKRARTWGAQQRHRREADRAVAVAVRLLRRRHPPSPRHRLQQPGTVPQEARTRGQARPSSTETGRRQGRMMGTQAAGCTPPGVRATVRRYVEAMALQQPAGCMPGRGRGWGVDDCPRAAT